MPKPLLLTRPSGLFVRFLVPVSLRKQVGRTYIVRRVPEFHPDRVRSFVANLTVTLSTAFEALAQEGGSMINDEVALALQRARNAGQYVVERDINGNITKMQSDGADDHRNMMEALAVLQPAKPPSTALSDAISLHVQALVLRRLAKDTITESQHTLKLFSGVARGNNLSDISADDIREFLEAIRWWPSRASIKPEYEGLTVKEIIKRGQEQNVPRPSVHTENKHMQRLKKFFNSPDVADEIPKKSVFTEMLKEHPTGDAIPKRPFTSVEVKQVFGSDFLAWGKKYPHRYFAPLISLYSGARVTEVAQLYLADIEERDGVLCFSISKRFFGQKLKNENSRRFIPIHSKLFEAGFIDYYQMLKSSGLSSRLFPHLPVGTSSTEGYANSGYGKQLSKQFSSYCKKFKFPAGTAFHAFRHTVATQLSRNGYQPLQIGQITGHVPQDDRNKQQQESETLAVVYIQDLPPNERADMIESLKYDIEFPEWNDAIQTSLRKTLRKEKFHK